MSLTLALLVIGAALVVGFAIGARVEEINLRHRERALAEYRRQLGQRRTPEPPRSRV